MTNVRRLRIMVGFAGGLILALTLLLYGCSSTPETRESADALQEGTVIEAIETVNGPTKAIITFSGSRKLHYRDPYALVAPPAIHLQIRAQMGSHVQVPRVFTEGLVREISTKVLEDGYTAVMISLGQREVTSQLIERSDSLVLEIASEKMTSVSFPEQHSPSNAFAIQEIDVTLEPGDRTRLAIAATGPLEHSARLEDNTLILQMQNASIDPDLLQRIASARHAGSVNTLSGATSPEGGVVLRVGLKNLSPYLITRQGNVLRVEFDGPPQAPPPRVAQATPSRSPESPSAPPLAPVAEERIEPLPDEPRNAPSKSGPPAGQESSSRAEVFEATSQQYAGERMSFDFVDSDIRNILKLISEVAGINIVWGADVDGKISMKLDNVPWDQALEMILKPNALTYQIEDDVLWVVPRQKLVDMEITEKKRTGALLAQKRLQGIFEAKVLEFIVIKHRKVSDIFRMLVGDPRAVPPLPGILDIEAAESEEKEEGEDVEGRKIKIATMDLYLSYDTGTNTIIANGVRAKVDKVKQLVDRLDIPEKQVMIEARVVDAATSFQRDLGIQWGSLERSDDGTPLRPGFQREWYNTGAMFSGSGQFSTNAPSQWSPNIGMALGWLTDGGLGSVALDASLALAESDGKAHVISAPKVLTVNGQEARISRGETRYIGVRTLDTQAVEDKEASLSLLVTPTVSADNSHVTLNVVVTDDRNLQPSGAPNDYGGKTIKEIQSTLLVRTGDTVVIGGIYATREEQAETGFPWVKDIPLFGWLFKAETRIAEKHELLIFLTPTVLAPPKIEGT